MDFGYMKSVLGVQICYLAVIILSIVILQESCRFLI